MATTVKTAAGPAADGDSVKSTRAVKKNSTGAVKKNSTKDGARKPKVEELPIVQEWILVSEAAEMAGVSRQYLHACLHQFESASRLSGFLAFRRAEVEEWIARRVEKLSIDT
jgi:predicted DNA-binding transcriptional regulator AlpA